MSAESLKKEARRHEQREEWGKALDLYLQALEQREEGEEPDIALHNRVGDLQIRLGDLEGAIASYEDAIRLYLDAELPNNAIAVCRKIVRHAPDRPATVLRMGQIRAKQGFMVDARQNFIGYAELMQSRGEVDEALRALEEFAGLAPEDVETRLFLADQLKARSRPNEAIYYLSEAYRTLASSGDVSRAEGILGRIRDIDPDYSVSAEEPAGADESGWGSPGEGWGLVGLDSEQATADEETAGPSEADGSSRESWLTGSEKSDEPGGGWSVDGLEITGFGMDDADEPAFGAGASDEQGPDEADEPLSATLAWEASVAFEDDAVDEEPLPLIHFELEEPLAAAEAPVETGSVSSLGIEEGIASLESTATGATDEPPAAVPASGPLADLRERVIWNPKDADAWRELGSLFFTTGSVSEGTDAFERAHALYAEQGDPERAMRVVRELLIRTPERIELRQRLVEYAHQTQERTLLVQAFLELADGLRAEGDDVKSRAVLEQVLAIDPANIRANEALRSGAPETVGTGTAPAPEGAAPDAGSVAASAGVASGNYIDLGAMVLEPEGEGTTRWVVKREEPSGDEEADFARMLSQFKQKVAQNISMDDARAHYDLGMAYKEMGLLREAIGEFQQALRAAPDSLGTFEMLGQCFLDLGDPEVAIRTLEKGLKLETEVEDELLGVYYGLALAHERVGNADTARDFYERIFSLDINFKDVVERLKALR